MFNGFFYSVNFEKSDYLGPGGFAWNHHLALIRNKNEKIEKIEKLMRGGLTSNLQAL